MGFINIFAITKGYNSALKDHFEMILTFFPKPFIERIENQADRAAHRKENWVLLLVIIILIGGIVGYVYIKESKKRRDGMGGYSFGGNRVDPYSNSVVEEKKGLINNQDDLLDDLQPERNPESTIDLLSSERNPQSQIDLLSSPGTIARAHKAKQENQNNNYLPEGPTPNGPTPG